MKKKKHPIEIPGYEGRLPELADFIVKKLRFDRVQEIHQLLSVGYLLESKKEKGLGHPKAAKKLLMMSKSERITAERAKKLWKICEPYTE